MQSPSLGQSVTNAIIRGEELVLTLQYSNHAEVRAAQRGTSKLKSITITKTNIESIEESEDGDTVVKAHVQLDEGVATVFVLSLRSMKNAYVITTYPKKVVDILIKEWRSAKWVDTYHRLPRRKSRARKESILR